ncbi:MAG: hypothetical protein ACLFPQ_03720 [Candidatus Woesearchaeota archaeon]
MDKFDLCAFESGKLRYFNDYSLDDYPFGVLDETIVHATNPDNLASIIKKQNIMPNSMFKQHGINTQIAIAFPAEDNHKRENDTKVYFSIPFSTIPEDSINLHSGLKKGYDFYDFDDSPAFKIKTVRLYFNKKIFLSYVGTEAEDHNPLIIYTHEGPFPLEDILEAILIPHENRFILDDFENRYDEKTILVKGIKENTDASDYIAYLNCAYFLFKENIKLENQKREKSA